ncbi:terpene synthase family protein [Streptomyces sp. NPDC004435]|uniref:terpene synthase family protein n=1 Tax=Streptomyces sp. NPDC004435 TaxID=3364701 RepID=UPI0036880210
MVNPSSGLENITHTTLGTPAFGASTGLRTYMPWVLDRLLDGRAWQTFDPCDYLIEGATLEWIYEAGLFRPDEYTNLQAYCMPLLANLWCLGEDDEVIDVFVRSMAWISALDDKINELGRPLAAYTGTCGKIIRTGELPDDANLYHRAGLDLRRHLIAMGAEAVLEEFAESMDMFLSAVEREERWRSTGHLPTVAGYLRNRQATIGVFPHLPLLRLKRAMPSPGTPVSTALGQLRWTVCRLIAVENDLLSSHKEERDGTFQTLLEVIKRAYGTDTGGALACALAIGSTLRDQHDQLLRAICEDPGEPASSRRYAEAMGTWVDSQTNYELSAPRYGMADFLGASWPKPLSGPA